MPNTEVKLTNAESTWTEASREDRKLLIKEKTLSNGCLFYMYESNPVFMVDVYFKKRTKLSDFAKWMLTHILWVVSISFFF